MFNGYRDAELIGEGGLGRVYRAVRISTGGVVAIKELREVPSASPAWHRAKRELEAMLRLKGHPYVVSVEEIFDGPEGPCLVMEFLDGGTLLDRIATGPLTTPELVVVGQQVTQALSAAHAVGIVHRDVKPHNLLVGSFGQVKVADFGIAALTRDAGLHTRTQAFTLAYASPEELEGTSEIGPAADAFSFAATMSHLATGKKPAIRSRSIADDLAALEPGDKVAATVAEGLRRCLEIDPAARPTLPELHRLFNAASAALGPEATSGLETAPVHAPTDLRPTDPIAPLPLDTQAEVPADPPTIVRPASALTQSPTHVTHAGLAPTLLHGPPEPADDVDTERAVALRSHRRTPRALLALVAGVVVTAIVAKAAVMNQESDPTTAAGTDSTQIGSAPTSPVATGAATGTLLRTIPHEAPLVSGTFSPDGSIILTTARDETVRLWTLAGENTMEIGGIEYLSSGTFSPDGTTILTTSFDHTAKLWSLDGKELEILEGHTDWVLSGTFSPDGTTILTTSTDGTAKLWSLDGKELSSIDDHSDWVQAGSFSPDGMTILTTTKDGVAELWTLGGNPLTTLPVGGSVTSGRFSPDGTKIVTARDEGTATLWTLEGQRLAEFTHADRINSSSFSPDGTTLLTTSRDGTAKLWDLDGNLLKDIPVGGDVLTGAFSPDGTMILTTSTDGTAKLWAAG